VKKWCGCQVTSLEWLPEIALRNVRSGSTRDLQSKVNWLATLVKLPAGTGQLGWQ
jgi:hypothetical protein